MVDINPNASGLQAQLQAQLQGGRGSRAAQNSVDLTPRPGDIIDERIKQRQSESDRQAPVQKSNRSSDLSDSRELRAAEERVTELSANRREAPVGRLSTQDADRRNQPLGQIIDIRV